MSEENPCLSCGACCAAFRVVFYWAEGADGDGSVPVHLTQDFNQFLRCMQGTNCAAPHCVALDGEIGQAVRCTIYPDRPSPCRDFAPAGEKGEPNERCDRARAKFGLPPLAVVRLSLPGSGPGVTPGLLGAR